MPTKDITQFEYIDESQVDDYSKRGYEITYWRNYHAHGINRKCFVASIKMDEKRTNDKPLLR